MGCVSSSLLNHDDELNQLGSSALGHHIVSLTSTTYGLLSLDPPPSKTQPTTPPPRVTLGAVFLSPLTGPKSLWSEPKPLRSEPEVINSWELMAGLDALDSFRFKEPNPNKENSNPNNGPNRSAVKSTICKPLLNDTASIVNKKTLDNLERLCPPRGENRVVIYTTSLRGVRKTFESCNAVRSAMERFGITICERDISMDRGFREELRELMRGKEEREGIVPPRAFVKGRYLGGVEEVLRMVEEGSLSEILEDLPRKRSGFVCEGCGDARFFPCFRCNGSCKIVMATKEEESRKLGRGLVARCSDCNENGLMLCPICS